MSEVAAAIALVGGLVALVTALINLRTAKEPRRPKRSLVPTTERTENLLHRPDCVDREEKIHAAIDQIRKGAGALVLHGAPGIGKSIVAQEIAYRLKYGEHPSGTLDLRHHEYLRFPANDSCPSLAGLCSVLTSETHDQSLSWAPEPSKLTVLLTHLSTNKTVLLLDDLNLTKGAAPGPIRALLQGVPRDSYVIASVNGPDELDAAKVRLGDLNFNDVREVIRRKAARLDLDNAEILDEDFARRLVKSFGGNPRMVDWFLRSLKYTSDSIDEIFEKAESGRGVAELYGPMWSRMSPDSRTVLGACAYLEAGATAPQIAASCALSDAEVSGALDELVRRDFVSIDRTRLPNTFTCSPAVRTFALAQTAQPARDALIDALTAHCIAYFGENWEDAHAAIPYVGAMQQVFSDLWRRGKDRELEELFAVMLDILFTLGQFDVRLKAAELAWSSADRTGNHGAASVALSVLSSTHALRGKLDEAHEALQLGLVAAEASGLPAEQARQMREAGFLSYRSGRPEDAIAAIEGADELARAAGDLRNLVDILSLRSCAHWHLGDLERSAAAAQGCLEVCEEIPWERGKAYPLRDLAEVAIHRKDTAHARDSLERARSIAQESKDRRQLARIALTEARMHLLDGDLRAARRAARDAEAQANLLGLPPEHREALALRRGAAVAAVLLPVRLYYTRRRPLRLTRAPVGGD